MLQNKRWSASSTISLNVCSSGEQKPHFLERFRNASTRLRSISVINPFQALEAYISLATTTDLNISCSAAWHNHAAIPQYSQCTQRLGTVVDNSSHVIRGRKILSQRHTEHFQTWLPHNSWQRSWCCCLLSDFWILKHNFLCFGRVEG